MWWWVSIGWAGTSALWGEAGELWDPRGRLPDFSYAGYQEGAEPPEVPVVVDVRDHGGVGDGVTDDTAALQSALDAAAEAGGGAVWVPSGTWRVQDVLNLSASGVVLRGEGPESTSLDIGVSLTDVRGPSEGWSWGGGFLWVEPPERGASIATVLEPAERGDTGLVLDEAAEGWAVLRLTDDDERSLGLHLHNDQAEPGDCEYQVPLVLDRPVWLDADGALAQPLRFDVRLAWNRV